jgi:beta-phosphoglucomutase-like phosphatase (HAD superfamily)
MGLKAVLLNFSGVIIRDEALHRQSLEELLLEENLPPTLSDYVQVCRGRSHLACLTDLWQRQGRVLTPAQQQQLLRRQHQRYGQALERLEHLPLYPHVGELFEGLQGAQVKTAIVSGTSAQAVEWVLHRGGLPGVDRVIGGEAVSLGGSKPAPDSYLLALQQLNQAFPELSLQARDCLAVEDSFTGITAAKRAGIPVIGVAHHYPYQVIHRRADWVIDDLGELDLDWLQAYYNGETLPSSPPQDAVA